MYTLSNILASVCVLLSLCLAASILLNVAIVGMVRTHDAHEIAKQWPAWFRRKVVG